jgi:fido (protein-threonine AMPylation protein)
MTDYAAAEAEAKRFRYPDSEVLINLADLRDQRALDAFERTQVARNRETLSAFDPTSADDFKHAHKHLFGTIYAWAGEVRTYTTGRGAAPFCKAEFIEAEMKKRFALIRDDAALLSNDPPTFAACAAEHISELNAIHPFLEGNGRMQRLLLSALAERVGLTATVEGVSQADWYAASEASFANQDYGPLATIILGCLKPAIKS